MDGESGAPLDNSETDLLEKIYDKVKPFMTEGGIAAIEKQGTWLIDHDGDKVTPLVNDICQYKE